MKSEEQENEEFRIQVLACLMSQVPKPEVVLQTSASHFLLITFHVSLVTAALETSIADVYLLHAEDHAHGAGTTVE